MPVIEANSRDIFVRCKLAAVTAPEIVTLQQKPLIFWVLLIAINLVTAFGKPVDIIKPG